MYTTEYHTVYLAGGFYANNWQEYVKKHTTTEFSFLDPKEKERGSSYIEITDQQKRIFSNPKTYTFWDLNAIIRSEIVFAFIDKNNPAVGVIAEIGYAAALGKITILVIEPEHTIHKDRYFDFLREMSCVCFDNLDDGIAFLNTLV